MLRHTSSFHLPSKHDLQTCAAAERLPIESRDHIRTYAEVQKLLVADR